MTEKIRINTGRRCRDGKIVHSFLEFAVDEEFDFTQAGWTSKKSHFPNNMIGGVWSFTETEDGNVWVGGENGPKFMYHLEDDVTLAWDTLDKSAAITVANLRKADKPAPWQKTIDTQLAPIRDILLATRDYRQRSAIIGYIINQVT